MPFVPLAAMGAIVFTLINFLKNLKAGLMSPVVTQLISWAAGIAVVCLFAHTDWADTITFGDRALSSLNGTSQIVIGLMAASLFGVATQVIKAVDGSDSAAVPAMLPDSTAVGSRP